MANWPSIKNADFGSASTTVVKPAIRSKSESGYTQTRARVTLAKEKRTLGWRSLSDADYATLIAFFVANAGGSFNFTDPLTSTTKEYTFADDELEFTEAYPGYKSGTVNLEEI